MPRTIIQQDIALRDISRVTIDLDANGLPVTVHVTYRPRDGEGQPMGDSDLVASADVDGEQLDAALRDATGFADLATRAILPIPNAKEGTLTVTA